MVFSSLVFLFLFLPINLALYYSVKQPTVRNWILIVFSLFFYAYGEPVWVSLLVLSATVDYTLGKLIENHRGEWLSKVYLAMSVVINLSLLGFFKYWNFFAFNGNFLLRTALPYHEFLLPIGISFYTFQTLSYSIDVYRGDVVAQRQYHKFLLFVSLFHQLVAGPIVRYKDISDEIENRVVNGERFSYGVNRFVQGLAKKVIFSNTAGSVVNNVFVNGFDQLSVLGVWFGLVMYSFQIYFDFSGYSDMAIGLGQMFGFTYKENFNYPYISRSVTEFWRRWHISLGQFFKDYVYFPLGGSKSRRYRNIFIVWMLTGLWHGANWNFVLWGTYFGSLLLLEKSFLLKVLERLPRIVAHLYVMCCVLVGWVLFSFTDLGQGLVVFKTMFGFVQAPFITADIVLQIKNHLAFIGVAAIASTPILEQCYLKYIRPFLYNRHSNIAYLTDAVIVGMVMVVVTSLLIGDTYNPFLYFRF